MEYLVVKFPSFAICQGSVGFVTEKGIAESVEKVPVDFREIENPGLDESFESGVQIFFLFF